MVEGGKVKGGIYPHTNTLLEAYIYNKFVIITLFKIGVVTLNVGCKAKTGGN